MKREVICTVCKQSRLIGVASKNSARCRKCASIGKNLGMKHTDEVKKKRSERQRGENNPFYGKHHTEKSKANIGKYERSDETKEQARRNLEKNRRDNTKSNYNIWLEKFGEEIANQKMDRYREKQSLLNSGEKNSMFGKPSPQGSGNGWSGWYNGHFFRSLLELSYLVYLLKNKILFESGELNTHRVKYDVNGKLKTYCCDFYLIETKEHIEIKPKRLCNTIENKAKFNAARSVHKNFKVLTENDFAQITPSEIVNLYKTGYIVWLKRYEEKFKKRYL